MLHEGWHYANYLHQCYKDKKILKSRKKEIIDVLKKDYVIETLAKGNTVIVCDFPTMRMLDCRDMTVNTVNSFIAKTETVFFKGVVVSE